ncbi:MAG: hypothetical protein FJ148_29025 [Deltaproteobacteria bacterium]|nr:hypothetical protein [Deltaproteobacteria bacterium]
MSKSITYGLLAVAVSSSLLVAQGEPAGSWSAKAGSGITYSGGDQFGINMLNFVQTRLSAVSPEGGDDTVSFDVPRTRTLLRGHAFNKNINYVLQVDYMDSSEVSGIAVGDVDPITGLTVSAVAGQTTGSILRDAYVHWSFLDGVGLRMGQGKTQWGLENTGTIRGTMFTERSLASNAFNVDRTRGAWLMGTQYDNKLRWSLGAVNGLGTEEEAANDDDRLGYVASANLDLMGDFFGGAREWWSQGDLRDGDRDLKGTIGGGYAKDTDAGADLTLTNVNTAWGAQGFQVMAEYYSAEDDAGTEVMTGHYLQGTYTFGKSGDSSMRWALGVRVSSVDEGGDETDDVSIVLDALYQGHNCKTQLELTESETGDETDQIVTLAFQLVF